MSLARGIPVAVAAVTIGASACGGMPGVYADAIGDGNETPGITSCSTRRSGGPVVASAYLVENPGERTIEIEHVDVVDASFEPVEVLVVAVPISETVAFGTSRLDDPSSDSPTLAAAWERRSTPPHVVEPGHLGQVLVVVPPSADADSIEYVAALEITMSVDGEARTITQHTLNMVGSDERCERLRRELYPDDV